MKIEREIWVASWESAKFGALRAHVPTCLACLRDNVPYVLTCLRTQVARC